MYNCKVITKIFRIMALTLSVLASKKIAQNFMGKSIEIFLRLAFSGFYSVLIHVQQELRNIDLAKLYLGKVSKFDWIVFD